MKSYTHISSQYSFLEACKQQKSTGASSATWSDTLVLQFVPKWLQAEVEDLTNEAGRGTLKRQVFAEDRSGAHLAVFKDEPSLGLETQCKRVYIDIVKMEHSV